MTYREYEDKIAQLRRERDLAIQQLKGDYGVGLGEVKDPDIVKVVRCKDCKYSRDLQTTSEKYNYCKCVVICTNGEISNTEFAVWGNDFCSYGEREGENV